MSTTPPKSYVLYWSRRGYEIYGCNSSGKQAYRCYNLEEIKQKLVSFRYASTGTYRDETANYGYIGTNSLVVTAGALAGLQCGLTHRPHQEPVDIDELVPSANEDLI